MGDVFLLNPDNEPLLHGKRMSHQLVQPGLALTLLAWGVLLCLLLVSWGLSEIRTASDLSQSGLTINGEIIDKRFDTVPGRGAASAYFVTYRFKQSEQDQAYDKEQRVSPPLYSRLSIGSRVMIRYLPANPTLSSLAETNEAQNLSGMMTLVAGFTGAALLSFFSITPLTGFVRKLRLLNQGRLIRGQVLSCRRIPIPLAPGSTEQFFIELSYRFRPPAGREIRASARHKRDDLTNAHLPDFGVPVMVLFVNEANYEVL